MVTPIVEEEMKIQEQDGSESESHPDLDHARSAQVSEISPINATPGQQYTPEYASGELQTVEMLSPVPRINPVPKESWSAKLELSEWKEWATINATIE